MISEFILKINVGSTLFSLERKGETPQKFFSCVRYLRLANQCPVVKVIEGRDHGGASDEGNSNRSLESRSTLMNINNQVQQCKDK